MRNDLLWLTAYAGCIASLIIFFAVGGTESLREVVEWTAEKTQAAAVFFVQSTTSAQIQNNYTSVQSAKKVRILIVPGHQPDSGGTEFNGVQERDIVADIASALATLLAQNPHYDVMVARGKTAWNPILQAYFDTHALEILAFIQSQSLLMKSYLADGSILPEDGQVDHNSAAPYPALQLFGINKWTSENKYDITLHLHLNDYVGRRAKVVGKYDGFTIYIPNPQYSNAAASQSVAEVIAARLNAYHATSTLPLESVGVVPDQELIATGSNNSADGVALLIEYGYIYESQFQNLSVQPVAIADYAYETYLGLQDFFKDSIPSTFGSVAFPYDWSAVDAGKGESGPGIYALQAALHYLGYYPPADKSFSDCPVSGKAGPCTRSAVEGYQRARGLEATGTLGPQTRTALLRDIARPAASPVTLQ